MPILSGPYLGNLFGPSSTLDPSTVPFVAAAGLNNAGQISAVDTLVKGLKADALWSLITALYPFVGGTALAHSINLRNPAQYQIAWDGSITHNSSGVTGGGGGGDTGLVPNSNSKYIGLYVSNFGQGAQTCPDIGAINSSGLVGHCIWYRWSDNNAYLPMGSRQNSELAVSGHSQLGYMSLTNSGPLLSSHFNGVLRNSKTVPNDPVPVSSYKLFNSQFTGFSASTRSFGTVVLGNNLTSAQDTQLYSRIQAFQTALGRAV